MKRYIALLILTVLGIRLATAIPSFIEASAPEAEVTYVTVKDVSTTVTCNGKLENTERTDISLSYPVVIGKVFVAPGDTVNRGEILATIDLEATKTLYETLVATDYTQYWATGGELPGDLSDKIVADNDGVVSEVYAENGHKAESGEVLMALSNGSGMCARIQIDESNIAQVQEGQSVELTGSAFTKTYTGEVQSLAKEARQVLVGTKYETVVECLVSIDEPGEDLRSGYNVKARIVTQTKEDVQVLPYNAVAQDDENRKYVYKIVDGWAVREYLTDVEETGEGVLTNTDLSDDAIVLNPEQWDKEYQRVSAVVERVSE